MEASQQTKTVEELTNDVRQNLDQARRSLECYRRVGEALAEIKRQKEGTYLKWLENESGLQVTRQQEWKYRRLHEHWSIVEPYLERDPDLGLEEARRIIKRATEGNHGSTEELKILEGVKIGLNAT